MPLPPNSHTNGVNFFLLDVFTLLPNRSNAQLLTRLIKKHTCPLPSRDPPPCSSRRPPLHPMRRGVGRAEGWPAGTEGVEGRGGRRGVRAAVAGWEPRRRGSRRPAETEGRGGRRGARAVAAGWEPGSRGLRRPAESERRGGPLGAWASRSRRPAGTEGAVGRGGKRGATATAAG